MSQNPQLLHRNKIAIIGNPNVGKSTIFNQITASYSLVANTPQTTVSVYRSKVNLDNQEYEIIDTPGILSLELQSEDELATRKVLIEEHPEVVIFCMDANNIKRSLLLAAQLAEFDIPMVICINFFDEAIKKGIAINKEKLGKIFGVPVVETVASEGRGMPDLIKSLRHAETPEQALISYKRFIEEGLDDIADCFPPESVPCDAIMMLLLLQDPDIEQYIALKYGATIFNEVKKASEKVFDRTKKELSEIVFGERQRWADTVSRTIMESRNIPAGKYGELFATYCRHPLWGWFILAGVIYITYLMVGKVGSEILAPFFEQKIFAPLLNRLGDLIPWVFVREFTVGDYGIFSTGLANAIGTALPILTMFFLILNLLEDMGYIPNLCVLTNRLFQRVGLSGKAILPVVLGFGCKTMATLTTKILESKKEQSIAIFLIAFAIPCAPLLGINLAILALFPFKIFLIVFGVLIFMEMAAGIMLNKILKTDVTSDFIMEIPPIRFPNMKNLIIKTYYRLKWFTVEAIPLFMIGACILFFMERFYVLDFIKTAILPIFVSVLNLPVSTVDAFLLCLLRKEAGAVLFLNLAQQNQFDAVQSIVAIILMNSFIPCFANIMAMIKQLGLKSALLMTLVITVVSAIMGIILNVVLRAFL